MKKFEYDIETWELVESDIPDVVEDETPEPPTTEERLQAMEDAITALMGV